MSDDLVKQFIAELQDLVQCRCHEAFKGRGLHDPDCHCDTAEAVKVVADRIEELEAKLAEAVEALRSVVEACDQGRMIPLSGVGGMTIEANIKGSVYVGVPAWPIEEARTTLAELTGGKDE